MVKKREIKKRAKQRRLGITLLVFIVLAISITGFLSFSVTDSEDLLSESDLKQEVGVGEIPIADSFIAFSGDSLNEGQQFFAFTTTGVGEVTEYKLTYKNPTTIKHPSGLNAYISTPKGNNCNKGEVVRYWFCDVAGDLSSCDTDMFDELWLIEKKDFDHPTFKNFYVFTKEFDYTYACYEPTGDLELGERSWLVENRCVSEKEANGQGTDFEFEKFCLIELQERENPNYVNPELEDENLDNYIKSCEDLGGTFDSSKLDCVFEIRGCMDNEALNFNKYANSDDGSCKFAPPEVLSDSKEDICEANGGVYDSLNDKCAVTDESTKEDICSAKGGEYIFETDSCDFLSSEGEELIFATVDEEVFNQIEQSEQDSSEELVPIVTSICKGYQVFDGEKCKFDFLLLFSDQGLKDIWNDFMIYIIGAIALIVGFIIYSRNRNPSAKGGQQ
jgi:hypothetical protein